MINLLISLQGGYGDYIMVVMESQAAKWQTITKES